MTKRVAVMILVWSSLLAMIIASAKWRQVYGFFQSTPTFIRTSTPIVTLTQAPTMTRTPTPGVTGTVQYPYDCPPQNMITPGAVYEPTYQAACGLCFREEPTLDPIFATFQVIETRYAQTVQAITQQATLGATQEITGTPGTATVTPTVTQTPTVTPTPTNAVYRINTNYTASTNRNCAGTYTYERITTWSTSQPGCYGDDTRLGAIYWVNTSSTACTGSPNLTNGLGVFTISGKGYTYGGTWPRGIYDEEFCFGRIDMPVIEGDSKTKEEICAMAGYTGQYIHRDVFDDNSGDSNYPFVELWGWDSTENLTSTVHDIQTICYGNDNNPTATPTVTVTPTAEPVDCRYPEYEEPAVDLGEFSYTGTDCFTLIPGISQQIPFTDETLEIEAVAVCVSWYTFPKLELLGYEVPYLVFAVMPIAFLVRKLFFM